MTDRVPFKPDPSPGDEAKKTPLPENVWKGTLTHMDDMNFHRMAEHLNISYEDRRDNNLADRINILYGWAKEQTKSDDLLQQEQAIKQLKNNLGYQGDGPDLVKRLYMWVRLDQDRKRIEQKMELMK